jgi:hypothetical protein
MTLFGTIDLGASVGGNELTYTPDTFLVEIDQAIMPVKAFHTKEEIVFHTVCVQYQMNLIAAGFSLATSAVTTVAGTPNTDTLYFGGQVAVQSGTFDFTVLKYGGGSGNTLQGHFNYCVSYKPVKLNFARDKNTELNSVDLVALADLTQTVGNQAGFLRDSYTTGVD